MGDDLDLGEAVDYIRAEAPRIPEDDVWAVLTELGTPPAPGADGLALELIARERPGVSRRHVKRVIEEWRAYASLADEPDWDE